MFLSHTEEEYKRVQQGFGALSGQRYYGAVAPAYNEGPSEEYDPTMPTEDEAGLLIGVIVPTLFCY